MPPWRPVADRILESIVIDDNNCWLWQKYVNRAGYAQMGREGRKDQAHRVSYETFAGPIPDGLTLDHLCRVRHCVNPAHLEPVTRGENVLRGESLVAQRARQTHCKRGHPFDEHNTYYYPSGGRECRQCKRDRRAAARDGRPFG